MDVTMSEAGVSAVCERVRSGHRGLQRLSVVQPLLFSPRVIVWWRSAIVRGALVFVHVCGMHVCMCVVSTQFCPFLRTLGRSLIVAHHGVI